METSKAFETDPAEVVTAYKTGKISNTLTGSTVTES